MKKWGYVLFLFILAPIHHKSLAQAIDSSANTLLRKGEQIYRSGNANKHITACIICHGPKGRGNAEAGFPRVSRQHAKYTILQLEAFKKGTRVNDLNHIMQDIAKQMEHDDMRAVALYIEGLY